MMNIRTVGGYEGSLMSIKDLKQHEFYHNNPWLRLRLVNFMVVIHSVQNCIVIVVHAQYADCAVYFGSRLKEKRRSVALSCEERYFAW